MSDEINNIKSSFGDDISNVTPDIINNKLNYLITKCLKKEKTIKNQLEKICFNILSEIFELPDNTFNFECKLVNEIHNNELPIHSEPDIETITITPDIQKRRFINMLSVGGALYITEKCMNLINKHIGEIDEELPKLYERILKINDLALFHNEVYLQDDDKRLLGYCKITLGDEEHLTNIESYGMIFPILLYESIKAFMEVFGTYSLSDFNGDNEKIMKVADALEFEPWDMRIGKQIFKEIFVNEDLNSKYLPYIFREFAEQNPNITNILNDTNKNTIIQKISQSAIKKYEYDSFEDELIKKQSDETIITDEFNVEENNDEVEDDYYGWS